MLKKENISDICKLRALSFSWVKPTRERDKQEGRKREEERGGRDVTV